jgi:hypothetical protein
LRLIDGTEYEVTRPDWTSVPTTSRACEILFNLSGANDKENERRWIDVGMISEVIIPPSAPAGTPKEPAGNGAAGDGA